MLLLHAWIYMGMLLQGKLFTIPVATVNYANLEEPVNEFEIEWPLTISELKIEIDIHIADYAHLHECWKSLSSQLSSAQRFFAFYDLLVNPRELVVDVPPTIDENGVLIYECTCNLEDNVSQEYVCQIHGTEEQRNLVQTKDSEICRRYELRLEHNKMRFKIRNKGCIIVMGLKRLEAMFITEQPSEEELEQLKLYISKTKRYLGYTHVPRE